MQTVFVNPGNPPKRRKRRKRSKPAMARKTRKRRTRRAAPTRRRRRRTRRRNAGIAPFVSNSRNNPLILQNPRRRRRKRNPSLNLKTVVNRTLTYSGGAAVGAGINILALRRIENDWVRNGARVVAALASGMLLKGEMGAAAAGATLYPLFAELALMTNLVGGATSTEADLHELAADLEAALDDIDLDDDFAENEVYVP